jgi:thiol-disulfide isomerase/thioredoxin
MAFTQKKATYVAIFVVGVALLVWWTRLNRGAEGFQDSGKKYDFIMYAVDWCGHCQKAKPAFMELGSSIKTNGATVSCMIVNPDKEPSKVRSKVDGFPTIHLYDAEGKLVKEYRGSRTKEDFVKFLQENAV